MSLVWIDDLSGFEVQLNIERKQDTRLIKSLGYHSSTISENNFYGSGLMHRHGERLQASHISHISVLFQSVLIIQNLCGV